MQIIDRMSNEHISEVGLALTDSEAREFRETRSSLLSREGPEAMNTWPAQIFRPR